MTSINSQIFSPIKMLSAAEKFLIINFILNNLVQPDPEIEEKLWSIEAENRLGAYEKGQIKTDKHRK